MTLSDFATFRTAIGGLAATAFSIYLAMRTHQNAKHAKAPQLKGLAFGNFVAGVISTLPAPAGGIS